MLIYCQELYNINISDPLDRIDANLAGVNMGLALLKNILKKLLQHDKYLTSSP